MFGKKKQVKEEYDWGMHRCYDCGRPHKFGRYCPRCTAAHKRRNIRSKYRR